MIAFRFAAAFAGLGALYLTGVTARHDLAPTPAATREIAAGLAHVLPQILPHPTVVSAVSTLREGPPSLRAPADSAPTGAIETPKLSSLETPPPVLPAERPTDVSRLVAAAALYRKGDTAAGDALAREVADPVERTAIEWAALRLSPSVDGRRLAAFATAHPHWPGGDCCRRRLERVELRRLDRGGRGGLSRRPERGRRVPDGRHGR
ncbi:MAG: hypothetical protein JO107_08125, partial [Hyphomicrobiales bacterium]|nr:hypothetical protein [Hyphomicrobiales bacterium]